MSGQPDTSAEAVAAPQPAMSRPDTSVTARPAWHATQMPARRALATARARGAPDRDRVEFAAGCPACGRECTWTEERDDTKVRISLDCRCA